MQGVHLVGQRSQTSIDLLVIRPHPRQPSCRLLVQALFICSVSGLSNISRGQAKHGFMFSGGLLANFIAAKHPVQHTDQQLCTIRGNVGQHLLANSHRRCCGIRKPPFPPPNVVVPLDLAAASARLVQRSKALCVGPALQIDARHRVVYLPMGHLHLLLQVRVEEVAGHGGVRAQHHASSLPGATERIILLMLEDFPDLAVIQVVAILYLRCCFLHGCASLAAQPVASPPIELVLQGFGLLKFSVNGSQFVADLILKLQQVSYYWAMAVGRVATI